MSHILNTVRDVDPNNSDAVKDALTTFFRNLPKHDRADCVEWMRSLQNVVNRFPKYCMSHRNSIEEYLIKFLISNNLYHVVQAAKCAHVLQQVRSLQEKTATAKTCWREQMNLLCDLAHKLLGEIFANSVDLYKNFEKTQKQESQPLANSLFASALNCINIISSEMQNDVENKSTLLCIRLRNVLVFIQAMLVEIYPVAKPIRPQTILDVIVCSLSVSSGTKPGKNQKSCDIATVKIYTLRTLDALIACLGPHLIPFSPLVIKSVMQTLRWSSDNPSKDNRKVRCTAYSSLGKWLNVLHAHRTPPDARGRSWEDEFTSHMVDDVTPPRHVIQLTLNNRSTKNLSKKAKKRLEKTMLQESTMASYMPSEKNKITDSEEMSDDVALAALNCAETFLVVCGMFLKPATYKRIQECIVRECYNLNAYTNERATSLLRLLEASRKTTPPTIPPPTQYCLQLYSVLINSRHREISSLCSQALLDIRLHLHCSPPSLNFALEVPQEKQKAENKRKTLSNRNRAVLESLLGKEKMPSECTTDEISDEPSSKKTRLEEEIVDEISVSSDSEVELELLIEEMDNNQAPVEEIDIEPIVIEDTEPANDDTNETIDSNVVEETNENSELNKADETNVEQVNKDTELTEAEEPNTEKVNEDIESDVAKETNVEERDKENTLLKEIFSVHEAATQFVSDTSNDALIINEEQQSSESMEVAYDYPKTCTDKVRVLERTEDENLPSTNDTDDIQITCGQDVNSRSPGIGSQKSKLDIEAKISDENKETSEEVPIVNGVNKCSEKDIENASDVNKNTVTVKLPAEVKDMTVADMMADFVDEVANENAAEA